MTNIHFITPEYPPQIGGVADHTRALATALASANVEVHVWSPGNSGSSVDAHNLMVHRIMGCFSRKALRRADTLLNAHEAPRRLFIQWVPHGFGYRSMNIWFCLWVWRRARFYGDEIEVLIHEPGLAFAGRKLRANAVAFVHRIMLAILINTAIKVWMSIAGWQPLLEIWGFSRQLTPEWLPTPGTIPVCHRVDMASVRRSYTSSSELLIGSFGTFGDHITVLIIPVILELLARRRDVQVLLIGQGSDKCAVKLQKAAPQHALRIHGGGTIPTDDLSACLQACDVFVQLYPDGISNRRTTAMALLEHGRAIVTHCGRLSEPFWCESGAVSIADSLEPECIIASICSLLDSPIERDRLARAAASLYDQRFHIRHVVRRLTHTRATTSLCNVHASSDS